MECPLCYARLSEWEVRNNKTEIVGGTEVHKACLVDYKLRMGVDYAEVLKKVQEGREARGNTVHLNGHEYRW